MELRITTCGGADARYSLSPALYLWKWLLGGLCYIAEKVAQVVTKHAKWLLKWLSFAST
jgi:hypothetical protein